MKKSLAFWQFVGFVFTCVFGTLLHFLFDLSGQSVIVAPFSAINESIWEHMKLLFFPMFIFALIQSYYFKKEYKNFWCAKAIGIAIGLIIIPTMYYTYTGALGMSCDWFNIAIFFIAAGVTYLLETKILKNSLTICSSNLLAFVILCIIGLMFIVLTFVPPHIPLFQDPITKLYGI